MLHRRFLAEIDPFPPLFEVLRPVDIEDGCFQLQPRALGVPARLLGRLDEAQPVWNDVLALKDGQDDFEGDPIGVYERKEVYNWLSVLGDACLANLGPCPSGACSW